MRQAGRSLPEYRGPAAPGSILDAIRRPELAAEITLQPVRRYGVDAAILFSDIVVPVAATGFGVDIVPGVGPVVERAVLGPGGPCRAPALRAGGGHPVCHRDGPDPVGELDVPLIGFAGAPFTVASYLIEGRPSRDYAKTKSLMYARPGHCGPRCSTAWPTRPSPRCGPRSPPGPRPSSSSTAGPGRSIAADYRRFVLPASAEIFAAVADLGVPRIHFGVGTGELLGLMAEAGADVVGVDWRVPLGPRRRPAPAGRVRCRATSTRPPAWPAGTSPRPKPGRCSTTPAGAHPGTSSTWATASCPRPTPTSWPGWSTSSTSATSR